MLSYRHWVRPRLFGLSLLVGIFSLALPARAALIFLDDFEGDGLNAVITDVVRTPTVGPSEFGRLGQPSADRRSRSGWCAGLDGKAAFVDVPQGGSLDYLGRLDGSHGNNIFLIAWDIEVAIDNGLGLFLFVSRSNNPIDMQVLFGFGMTVV